MNQTLSARPIPGIDLLPLMFSGDDTVVAQRTLRTWSGPGTQQWADQVLGSLRPGQVALGALPFVPDDPAVMHQIAVSKHLPPRPLHHDITHHHVVTHRPTPDQYEASVRAALAQIADGQLDKVVLGRCLDVVSSPPLAPDDVVGRLLETRPGRYVFSVPLSDDLVSGPTLIGASPELLVRRQGRNVSSLPLAGSVPRSADPTEDAQRAEALLSSDKDLDEHAFVVEQIVATLQPLAHEIHHYRAPRLLATDTMWHLATAVRARLATDAGPSALHLARLLHPTPAVGGVPTQAALHAIAELEGPDLRGPLAGAVGWVDAQGNGEFAIAIRSGVLEGEHLRLFAGAGIVAGSDPRSEVEETSAKLATMARAVGL